MDVKPVVQPHRRVPFHLRRKLEAELDAPEAADIIEKVQGPTPWVSPIFVAPKTENPGKIRLCVDMRLPNAAIKRKRHVTLTLDDIFSELNESTIFSKLDRNKGYHQLELLPESRYITTFATHVILRRYKRLKFGTSSAAEAFQEAIRGVIQGVRGTLNISDDIIVHGNSRQQHDEALRAVLNRLEKTTSPSTKQSVNFTRPP